MGNHRILAPYFGHLIPCIYIVQAPKSPTGSSCYALQSWFSIVKHGDTSTLKKGKSKKLGFNDVIFVKGTTSVPSRETFQHRSRLSMLSTLQAILVVG